MEACQGEKKKKEKQVEWETFRGLVALEKIHLSETTRSRKENRVFFICTFVEKRISKKLDISLFSPPPRKTRTVGRDPSERRID